MKFYVNYNCKNEIGTDSEKLSIPFSDTFSHKIDIHPMVSTDITR